MTTTDAGLEVRTLEDIRAIPDPRERFDAVAPARQAHLDAIAELAQIPRDIVAELRAQGLKPAGIGERLGITRQRAEQLSMTEAEVAAAEERDRQARQARAQERRCKRDAETAALRAQVADLRAQGLTHAAVAEALGIPKSRELKLAKTG